MKKSISMVMIFALLLSFISCKKEKDNGVKTVITGHVSDTIRGINTSGYKIVLVKKTKTSCANWECLTEFEEVATVYSDNNGDYSITFNFKLNPGQDYYLEEQYYGIPYYHESTSGSGGIIAGSTNTINMFVWKPIELKLAVEVLNNNNPPLHVRNELANNNTTLLNTENIYEPNIKSIYSLKSRPNSDINIIFWYYAGSISSPVLHQKTILYRTTLDDMITLGYTIDCST